MKWFRLLIMFFGVMGFCVGAQASLEVLCTMFPIYQITRNVAQGREGVRVVLMLPASLGCPHHYSLTTQDMRKLARADVLVVNGLGLEEFLGAPVIAENPQLRVVDSSQGIDALLQFSGGKPVASCTDCVHGHGDHHGANPHLFVSPRMVALLAQNIASGLSEADPEGAEVYARNAAAYAAAMHALADEMAKHVQGLKNNRIVQPHGIYDYLARDIGLEVVAVTQPHGLEPSAAEMLKLVETIRAKEAGAIFTEPQYSARVGQTLSRETGIPTAVLDPAASGPDNAPLDYYVQVMRQNIDVLRATLGVHE